MSLIGIDLPDLEDYYYTNWENLQIDCEADQDEINNFYLDDEPEPERELDLN
jgi:hypothetical protein